MALADAKTAADAALKMVQDELDELKIDTADAMAAAALAGKIARAGEVHDAIGTDPGEVEPKMMPTDGGSGVSGVTAKRNAAGMVTVDVNGTATTTMQVARPMPVAGVEQRHVDEDQRW